MAWKDRLRFTTAVKVWFTTAASVLGFFLVWMQLGWPVPAFTHEVEAAALQLRIEMAGQNEATMERVASLEKFNLDTRSIVLSFEWERLFKLIKSYENKSALNPSDEQLLIEWKIKIRNIEGQLRQLNGQSP